MTASSLSTHTNGSVTAAREATVGDAPTEGVTWRVPFVVAGALGAALWGAQIPLDKKAFRYGYDDVELLGKLGGKRDHWKTRGYALHMFNGAVFGLAYSELWKRTRGRNPWVTAQALSMAEHVGLFPLGKVLDVKHPAVRKGEHPKIFTGRAFAQATWRHLIIGAALAAVASRKGAGSRGVSGAAGRNGGS